MDILNPQNIVDMMEDLWEKEDGFIVILPQRDSSPITWYTYLYH